MIHNACELIHILLYLQVMFGWRKVCVEFRKKIDPDLPFHYFTSAHNRYYEDVMPDFSTKPLKPKKCTRLPMREMIGQNVGRLATIAVRGKGSMRATFHKQPIDLPPVPQQQQPQVEHSYAATL